MRILMLIVILLSQSVFASHDVEISRYFNNKNGCFILYDVNDNKTIERYNPKRCAQRIPANSTFKIALSLMGYDSKIINNNTVFKWDGETRWLKKWNQNQTPRTWIQYSVVWVSQRITPQLGMGKIKNYLQKFNYGNQDFSGDTGKSNGLTNAWLNSSLKISADEQLSFLINMQNHKLPVSSTAITNTFNNMYIENSTEIDLSMYGAQFDTLKNDWKLYGKTGANGATGIRDGWFIGYITKGTQKYVVVTNFSDTTTLHDNISAGGVAKGITIQLLNQLLKTPRAPRQV